jgi:dihydroorotate dehydrogenase electron transfer subunit
MKMEANNMFLKRIKKGWQELETEIIEAGKCVYCGACGAFCANVKFNQETEEPYDDGSCEEMNTCRDGYGICYNLCPKTGTNIIPIDLLDKWVFGKEHDNILGHYKDILLVKVKDSDKEWFNNADPITALLAVAMDNDDIDCAIFNKKDEMYRPVPYLAREKEDLKSYVNDHISQAPSLSLIGEAINEGYVNIAYVGNPCQIQGLRKIQNHPRFDFEAYDLVSLAIGTFCFGTFHNEQLSKIFQEYDIDPKSIKRIERDEKNFKLRFITNNGVKEITLNQFYDRSIRNACFSCSDYTASFADISVGNIGNEEGWNTVIVRTEKGQSIFDSAVKKGYIETKELEQEKRELVLNITRASVDIVKIEDIIEHSPNIKSFWIRNPRIAKAYRPGNFVILWLPDVDFLPMSISDVKGSLLEITVEKIGEGTSKLFELEKGDMLGIRGPFGNSWNYEDASNILVIGGGLGVPAVTTVIQPLKENNKNVFVAIGAKNQASLLFEERFRELVPNTLCTTDDGSYGKKCYVTDPIEEIIEQNNVDLILTCGPEVMMKKVLEIANLKDVEVQASLERKMKCGVGLCGSCCIGEKNDVAVCEKGPIFNSEQLNSFPQFGTYKKE